VSRGFALESDTEFMRSARESVMRTVNASSDEEKGDVGVMKEKIRADLKRFISRETQRRPMIMPVILEI
jgi:ribonuclease J